MHQFKSNSNNVPLPEGFEYTPFWYEHHRIIFSPSGLPTIRKRTRQGDAFYFQVVKMGMNPKGEIYFQ
jgi:hypothetical protein